MEPVSEIHEEEVGAFSTGVVLMSGFLSMCKNKIEEWTVVVSLRIISYSVQDTLHSYTSFVSLLDFVTSVVHVIFEAFRSIKLIMLYF